MTESFSGQAATRKRLSHWPEGFTPPAWLPDWQDETAYERLRSRVVYSYETIPCAPDPTLDPDAETNDGKSARKLKPGSLKSEKISTLKQEFAWEFLRRNPYYQADYLRLVELSQSEGVADSYRSAMGFNILVKGQAPLPSIAFHAALYRALTRWGILYRLPDPAFTLHGAAPLEGITRVGNDFYLSQETCEVDGETIPLDGGIILTDTETLWLFDVSLPIKPQLDKAKQFLDALSSQTRTGRTKATRTKADFNKFTTYLRILDAGAAGADGGQIATLLYPDKSPTDYSNYSPHRDALNHDRLPAYQLRDQLYRLLL